MALIADSLTISGGVTSTGLVAGNSTVPAAQYRIINVSGAKAVLNNGVVSSGGSLTASAGALINGVTAYAGGSMRCYSGGVASNLVCSGGSVRFDGGAAAYGVIASGGTVSFKTRVDNVQVGANGKIGFEGGAGIGGNRTNFTSTQLVGGTQYYNMHINCTNGVLTGSISKTFGIYSGIVANNMSIVSGGNFFVNSGGVMSGGTMVGGLLQLRNGAVCNGFTMSGGTVSASNGSILRDLTVSGGVLTVVNGAPTYDLRVEGDTARVALYGGTVLGGGRTNFTAGQINAGADFVNNVNCTNGELTGVLNKNLTIRAGIHAEDLSIINLGLTLSSGALMNGGTVTAGASTLISSGAVVNGILYNGGSCVLNSGGMADDIVVSGGGTATIYNGATVRGATLRSGSVTVLDGAPVYDLQVSGDNTLVKLCGGAVLGGDKTTFTAAQIAAGTAYVNNINCASGALTGVARTATSRRSRRRERTAIGSHPKKSWRLP